jgi:hypothetical protein
MARVRSQSAEHVGAKTEQSHEFVVYQIVTLSGSRRRLRLAARRFGAAADSHHTMRPIMVSHG